MPDIGAMFPRKFWSYKDMGAGESIVLTVEDVRPVEAKSSAGWKTARPAWGQPSEPPEVLWALYVRELPRPIELRKSRASILSNLFKSTKTEDWVGKQFRAYRGMTTVAGESVEGLLFDPNYVPLIAAAKLLPAGRMIPKDSIDRFLGFLLQKQRSWSDFLQWLKRTHESAALMAYGQDFDAIDVVLAPVMKQYLDAINTPEVVEPPAPPATRDSQPLEGTDLDIPV